MAPVGCGPAFASVHQHTELALKSVERTIWVGTSPFICEPLGCGPGPYGEPTPYCRCDYIRCRYAGDKEWSSTHGSPVGLQVTLG